MIRPVGRVSLVRIGFVVLLAGSLLMNGAAVALTAWIVTRPSPPTLDPNPVCHLVPAPSAKRP